MAHDLKGQGKIYQFKKLIYTISFLAREIETSIRITLENNRNDLPPSIIPPLLTDKLQNGRGQKTPENLERRRLKVCWKSGQKNSMYIPYPQNDPRHNQLIKQAQTINSEVEAFEYISESWTQKIEEFL